MTQYINFTDAWVEKYRFRKLLGQGAFATVWLADECSPTREVIRSVAIKVFVDKLEDRASFQETFENFQLDLRFLADFAPNHPIIQYYNSEMADIFVDETGGVATVGSRDPGKQDAALTAFLIVMEYADGGSIGPTYREEVIVQRQDNLYLDHFIDISAGLREAHARNIIHRDIKPRNLMWFRKSNRVKIGDFGIAKHINEMRGSGFYVTGTPPYMSPESFNLGSAATPQRDIYALGCTFYEILTGEQAFNISGSSGALGHPGALIDAFQRLHEREERPDAVIRTPHLVSVRLSALIKRMMSREAGDRPSLDEVIDALRLERKPPIDPVRESERVKLHDKPIYRSSHNVSPSFRHEQLKESTFFLFITMAIQGSARYRMLFALLEGFFGDTYSICELFGRYDFLVRVWSTRPHVSAFCEQVISQLLDDNRNALHVLAVEEVTYLGAASPNRRKPAVTQVLVKLNEAQSGREGAARVASQWLQQQRIYVRKLTKPTKESVHCFCLVSCAENVSQEERLAKGALIIREIDRLVPGVKKLNLTVYRKAYLQLERLNEERCDYLIAYMAPSFMGVSRVPSLILDELNQQRLRNVTLLASGRYFVDSDNVQPQPQRGVMAT